MESKRPWLRSLSMGALERRAATTQQAHSARIQTHTCTCPCSCLVFAHYLRFCSAQPLFRLKAMSRAQHPSALPAHETKHIAELEYPFQQHVFRLTQLDNGLSNGTALWLGAQCLSVFLAHVYGSKHRTKQSPASKRPRAIELGSGIGLSAYVFSSSSTCPVSHTTTEHL